MKFSGCRTFKYLFYIDFEASLADPRAQYALENLQVSQLSRENIITPFLQFYFSLSALTLFAM